MGSHSCFYDYVAPIYRIVKEREFCSYDLPRQYRKKLRGLENNGYLVRTGRIRVRKNIGTYIYVPRFRISRRFLWILENGKWE